MWCIVLAPTDAAFAAFFAGNNSASTNYSSTNAVGLETLLTYHVLKGVYSDFALNSTTQFIPTLLTNTSYANVTGGQRVEASSVNGAVTFYSAVDCASQLVKPDIAFYNGLVQVIDAVLVPPVYGFETATEAGLEYFLAIMSDKYLTGAFSELLEVFQTHSDMTLFAGNSPQLAAALQTNADAFGNQTEQELVADVEYYILEGTVAYSTMLTNGATFQTMQGNNITITVQDGATYVNAAKISIPDLLISNGVIQVIDAPLNYTQPNQRPSVSVATSSTFIRPSHTSTSLAATNTTTSRLSSLSRLGTADKAGIGMGVAIVTLAGIALAIYILRWRRQLSLRRTPGSTTDLRRESSPDDIKYPELEGKSRFPLEIDGRILNNQRKNHIPEIDGRELYIGRQGTWI